MGIQPAELHHQHKISDPGSYHVWASIRQTTNTRIWVNNRAFSQLANYRQPVDTTWGALLELEGGETVALETDGVVTRFDIDTLEQP